jgi:dihydrofolate synthase/folylpolyglutamate synthase
MTMELAEAIAWLESHVNLEAVMTGRASAPSLDGILELCGLMGDPQNSCPVIHITGTNGKGSTARMTTALVMASNLSPGTFTSPDLQRINERIACNGASIADHELAEVLSALCDLEAIMSTRPSRFDLLTAAAFRWFADLPVDVAVLEVGLGGRWDATNVASGVVAVVTNIELDHQEILGPSRADIAAEKAGIVKPGSTLILGETDESLAPIFESAGAAATWRRDVDFGCGDNQLAVGGRLVDLWTQFGRHDEVFLPLHGAHQGDNAACALAAVEAFFGRPLDDRLVREAFASVRTPGRMEVVGRHPLVLLDGAHNPAGARAAAATLDDEFAGAEGRVLVVGMLKGRDPAEMLAALGAGKARLVVATRPPSPRALPPDEVAMAARAMGCQAVSVEDVAEAVRRAVEAATPGELVLVAGSLYVVGAARRSLVGEEV